MPQWLLDSELYFCIETGTRASPICQAPVSLFVDIIDSKEYGLTRHVGVMFNGRKALRINNGGAAGIRTIHAGLFISSFRPATAGNGSKG
jgi:hypothetical protein